MNRIFFLFSFILFCLSNSLFASNQYANLGLSKQEIAWLNKTSEIKMGIQTSWIPLSYVEGGKPRGLGVDYINLINSKLNGKIKIYADNFKNNLEKVKSGKLDAMIDITPTESRKRSYYFTTNYANIPHFIVSRKSNKNYYNDVRDLNGKTVVVEKGYGIVKKLRKVAPNVKFKYFDNTVNAIEALASGIGDAYVGNRAVVNHIMRESFISNLKFDGKSSISRSILAIGVNRQEEILRDILQKALDSITLEQKQKIYENYIGKSHNGIQVNLTDKEKKYLKTNSVVIVGGEKDWSPFDFVDENGNYSGISKDIFELAAKRAGLKIKYRIGQNWQELIKDFKNGKLDVLPAMYKNEQREKFTIFTKPYFTVKDYAFVRSDDNSIKNIDDLAKKRVAIIDGYAIEKNLKKRFPHIKLFKVKNKGEGIDAVLLDKADVYIDGYAVMMYTISSKFITGLKPIIPIEFYSNDLYIGINKKKPLLASIIKKGLDTISIVEKNKILNKWLLQENLNDSLNKYSKAEKKWLKKHNSIRLAYMGYWPVDDNGKNIHSEYTNLLSRYGDININLVKFDRWQDGFQAAAKGKNVQGILNLSWSKEREANSFDYTKPYFFTPAYIVVKKGNNSIKNIEDLKGKPLYLKKDSITLQIVKQLKYNIDEVVLKSDLAMLKALSKKDSKADAILTYSVDPELLDTYGLKVANKFYNRYGEVYIGVSKNQKEVLSILNKAYERIPKNELSLIQNKIYKHRKRTRVELTQKEKEFIKEHPVLKVLNEVDWPPYDFDINGEATGYSIEYIKELAKIIGIKLEFVKGTWSELLKKFENKQIDLIHLFNKTPQREQKYLFSKPYMSPNYAITIRKDTKTIKNIDDLKGKKVACGKDWESTKIFKKLYPDIKVIEFDNLSKMLKALSFGKVDAVLDDMASSYYNIVKDKFLNLRVAFEVDLHEKGKDNNWYLAVHKGNELLLSILNKAIKAVPDKTLEALNRKWFGESEKLDLTKKEQRWLNKHQSIKYVYDTNWAPFEWKNELGEHSGIIYDILSLISEKSGIKFQPVSTNSWSESVELMKNKKADMYSAIGENKEREKYLQFTKNTIFKTPYVFVSRSEDKNDYLETFKVIENKKVAVVDGYTIEGLLEKEKPNIPLIKVKTIEEGFNKVRDGSIDIFIVNAATAKYFIHRMGYDDLKIATKTEFNLNLKIALQKDFPKEAVSIIDKAIDAISQKELSDIYFKWTEAIVEKTINWRLIYQITGAALILLLVIIYWNRKLKTLVDQKTNEIRLLLRSFDKNVIASKTDKEGIITYVSDKFCEISGYSREELIGNTHAVIRHSETPKELFVDLWKTVKADKVWRGEIKNRTKEGNFVWVYAIISPECDPSGDPCGYSTIMQDITAKKEVEELSATLEQKVIERTSELNDERKFIQAIMNSQTNIVISSDGRCLRTANKAFLDFYKVKNIDEFTEKFGDCICDTFDKKDEDGFIQKEVDGEKWIDYVYKRADMIHKVKITRDNKEHIFTITADKFTLDGKELKTAVFTDITELEKIREQIEAILSNILLPILITSRRSRKILYANKHAQIQYEKPLDQIVGKSIDEVYTMQGQQYHILEAIERDGKIENSEEVFKTFSGKEFTALLSVTPIKYQGEDALIGMVTDITKQKLIEAELKEAHAHTKSSIEYASLIQHAIIPKDTEYNKYFEDHFTIWEPKDIVGGDIYLFNELRTDDECLMMVIDCTGHGVPGAFVTMLVKAIERQVAAIIESDPDKEVDPAWILEYFNRTMKYLLRQEDDTSISNAGFDAAVLYYNKVQNIVKFAGAELPLFYIQNGEYKMIKGDRQSIGYKKSDMDYKFKEHIVNIKGEMNFYMTTDGYLDQNGGEKGFPYGKKRFKTLIEENCDKSFEEQKNNILDSLLEYQGEEERNDDVTIIGMKIVEYKK